MYLFSDVKTVEDVAKLVRGMHMQKITYYTESNLHDIIFVKALLSLRLQATGMQVSTS